MNNRHFRYALATALLASLALAGCKKNAPEADTAMTPAPIATPSETAPLPAMDTALSISSVTLGKEAGADMSISQPLTEFGVNDPIIVSVATNGAASDANIHARLVFEDGQVAGEQSQTINATGMETTNITFTNANAWPVGSYTAEVSVNDAPPHNTAFSVK